MTPAAPDPPPWLAWVRDLQAIAQNGLTYATDPYDIARYTQVRGIAVQMASYSWGLPAEMLRDVFAGQLGHITPKVDVRGAVFGADGILLVRERSDGGWTLPGGWADPGEAPAHATEREVWEESGYEVRARKLAMLYDRDRHGHPPHPFAIYKLFFLCDLLGGAPAHSHETDGVGFFPLDALPDLSLSRVTPAQIARLFAHQAHPDWPTDFD